MTTIKHLGRSLSVLPIVWYQRVISPMLPKRCKYVPSCSTYALIAIRELGIVRGVVKSLWRVLRCNPFSHGGYDPPVSS